MDLLEIQPDSIFCECLVVLQTQNQIIGYAVFQDQTVPMPVFRNQPQSMILSVTDFILRDVITIHHNTAAVRHQFPAYDIYQFLLAIAVYACNSKDLTFSQFQIDVIQLFNRFIDRIADISDLQYVFRLLKLPAGTPSEVYITPHHHSGQFRRVSLLLFHGSYDFSQTDHGDPVGNLHHLCQFVADKDDGLSFLLQFQQNITEFIDLLRC